jgi:hypothetical protein
MMTTNMATNTITIVVELVAQNAHILIKTISSLFGYITNYFT